MVIFVVKNAITSYLLVSGTIRIVAYLVKIWEVRQKARIGAINADLQAIWYNWK